MGGTALIIFLASLGLAFLSFVLLVSMALRIYRTVRYAYKDSQPWIEQFKEYSETLAGKARLMEERVQNLSQTGHEMRERMDDIQDAIEELRSHPLLRTAHFVGRHRR